MSSTSRATWARPRPGAPSRGRSGICPTSTARRLTAAMPTADPGLEMATHDSSPSRSTGGELARLAEADRGVPWRFWGPYLSERQWGTVREDYSPDGTAWEYVSHDHARSRAYRWGEDGLAGISDDLQRLCFALAFWNGVDPILKERIFGLTGNEGNHGEDAKEYWWYTDATPTASWLRWQYVYPQHPFPYSELVAENRRRGRGDMEYELLDTGIFDGDRYWDITVDYAKADPEDICVRVHLRNAGPEPAVLHVLPTLWFRNTWSWAGDGTRPSIRVGECGLVAEHPELGVRHLCGSPGAEPLFCENETNFERVFGVPGPGYPKDGVNDHLVLGRPTVNPARVGTRAALHYLIEAGPGGTAELRLRLAPKPASLAFHTIALAHIDPGFAKQQLLLMCREWYMHPNGQLPAYEWAFGDVNPPVHPFAALRVFQIDGERDHQFLERVFHKLLINFTWWVNRKDAEGNNLFEGGFLGLDNMGPSDRSQGLPIAAVLEQSDGTAWMAVYCLGMLYMAIALAEKDPTYDDVAIKFIEHFTYIAEAINDRGLWNEEDGFYYDRLAWPGGGEPVRVRSIVGLLPLAAAAVVPGWIGNRVPELVDHLRRVLGNR